MKNQTKNTKDMRFVKNECENSIITKKQSNLHGCFPWINNLISLHFVSDGLKFVIIE